MTDNAVPAETPAIRFRAAPSREGALWVRDALAAFVKQPLGFAALFALCALVLTLLVSIPYLGDALLVMLVPVGSLLFMIATRRAAAGTRPIPAAFVELAAGRDRFTELAKLGVAYLVGAGASMLLIAWVDGGAMAAFMEAASNPQSKPEALAAKFSDPRLHAGFWLRVVVALLLAVPFWHAPALVFWGRQRFFKALFFSSVAIWRNKGAFVVYGLVWVGVGIGMALLLGIIIAVAGQRGGAFMAMPLMLLVSTVVYASLWYTFAGCFVVESLPQVPGQLQEPSP